MHSYLIKTKPWTVGTTSPVERRPLGDVLLEEAEKLGEPQTPSLQPRPRLR